MANLKTVTTDPFFDGLGMTVDVFHFRTKHKKSDMFCQANCNPEKFPDLKGENGKSWWFNSSIAEQTNVWLGGYHYICREMSQDRYDFFLDEMVARKNKLTFEKLVKNKSSPTNVTNA